MIKVTVEKNQNIVDMAVQEYGGIEGLHDLWQDNPDQVPTIDAVIRPGQELKIYPERSHQPDMLRYLKRNDITVATGNEYDETIIEVDIWVDELDNTIVDELDNEFIM